jgi:glycosyltransferase 2 family protein
MGLTDLDAEAGTLPAAKHHEKLHIRRIFAWLLRALLGSVALAYVLHFIDVREVWQRVREAEPIYLAAAFALSILQYVVFAVRWRWLALCARARLPAHWAVVGNLELAFFTQLVPTALAGDAIRIIRAQRAGLTLSQSIASVSLDRIIGLATVVFLAPLLLTAPSFAALDRRLLLAVVLLPCIFIAGLFVLYFLGPVLTKYLPNKRVVSICVSVSEAFRTLVLNRRLGALAILASIGGNLLAAEALSCVGASIGVPIGVFLSVPIICLMTLAVFIPASIGGWGLREGAALVVLSAFAVSAKDAVALSIMYGLVGTAVGIVGGITWLSLGFSKPRRRVLTAETHGEEGRMDDE